MKHVKHYPDKLRSIPICTDDVFKPPSHKFNSVDICIC